MENFLLALNCVIPFVIYMSFGYIVKSVKWASEDLLMKMNTLAFKCFFPIVMFTTFYKMDFAVSFDLRMIAFAFVSIFAIVFLSILGVSKAVKEDGRKGVIVQALFRSNSILFALPLAESVLGNEGFQIASVTTAIMVPLYNVLAAVILTYYGGGKPNVGKLVKSVFTNPIIIGAIAGALFLIFKIRLPEPVYKPVKALSDMTTPLALFVLGGTIHVSSIKKNWKPLSLIIVLKLVIVPLILVLIAGLVGLTPDEKFVVISIFATPVAVSSYPMAANMGCDGELAGQVVCFTTIFCLFTLFSWILVFKNLGII